ncbi:lysozyme inhibitor LprI family protein [Ottowia flava]|uniref:Lysozyme inhibitor LprI family protein n=1 Tax=Ottowia flava TaxID=2675430 RepID=A0ABW4KV49_9BURK
MALYGSAVAWAQAGADCRPGGSVAESNACAVRDYQQADTDLQILYGDVMRALSAHERPALRQGQSAWQRTRVAQCKTAQRAAEALPEWPRLYHECLTTQTRGRRAGLMHWLQHGEAPPS